MDGQEVLLEVPGNRAVWINEHCCIRDEEGMRVIFCGPVAVYRHKATDRLTERYAAVMLVEDGLAKQLDVSAAIGVDSSTVRRWQERYEASGIRGLSRKARHSPLLKMVGGKDRAVRRMFKQGKTNVAMAQRLGVGESTIRRTLKRLGLEREHAVSGELGLVVEGKAAGVEEGVGGAPATDAVPEASGASEAPCGGSALSVVGEEDSGAWAALLAESGESGARANAEGSLARSLDSEPLNRVTDRALARLGLLEDAVPLFAPAKAVVGAGVLLAVPLIVGSGVLEAFKELYRSLGPAFFGLRTVVLTLLSMALLRIKRVENLKERCPQALGRILGLDRAPEVKTVRRKLGLLARAGKGAELMRELARRRLNSREQLLGYLYVDGHVREYHGKGNVAKGYVPRRRLASKASTDTWVNDARGDPVFLVTSELNQGLTEMLEPVLDELKEIVGGERRVTMVFDRGGWSLELFARIIERGHDILTYRKGKCKKVSPDSFHEATAEIEGRKVTYTLHEMKVRMGKTKVGEGPQGKKVPLWLRQVSMLRQGERQTQVLTTRQDLEAAEVLWWMFNRWRQENFLKYMREEYAIDGLVDYNLEPVNPQADRPNPARKAIEEKLRKARTELEALAQSYGVAAMDNVESKRRTMRGFKIAHSETGRAIQDKRTLVSRLKEQRDALPKRVSAGDLDRLSTQRKLVTDCIKMTAYQIENDLVRMVAPHYRRADDEGHKLIVAALKSAADLDLVDGELRVTLTAQSSPHRTRAIAKMCEQLNATNTSFPGTDLRLRYAVSGG